MLLLTCLTLSIAAKAQINLKGNWSPIDNTLITKVTNDPDGDDGVGDGALFINGTTAEIGQGVLYSFGGTMESAKTYTIDTYIYNFGNSHSKVIVSLLNSTTNTVLATSKTVLLQTGVGKTPEQSINLTYTATDADTGGMLQLKYTRTDDGNTSRDFNIDNARLNGDSITSPLLSKKNKK